MSKEAWPTNLHDWLYVMFQIETIWKPADENEEPPF